MATAPPVAVEEAAAEGDVVAAAEEREPEEPQPGPPSDDERASFPCPPCDIKEQCWRYCQQAAQLEPYRIDCMRQCCLLEGHAGFHRCGQRHRRPPRRPTDHRGEPQVAAEPSAAAVAAVPDSAAAAAPHPGDPGQDEAPTQRADNLIDGDHLPLPEMLIISLTLMIFGGVRTYVGSPKQRYLRG